jgi:hypothetical protein
MVDKDPTGLPVFKVYDWESFEFLFEGPKRPDINGRTYDFKGSFMAENPIESYQGLAKVMLLQDNKNHKNYGYFFWEDIGKHSDGPFYEPNGDEYGLEYGEDEDGEYSYFVYRPVHPFPITGYRFKDTK